MAKYEQDIAVLQERSDQILKYMERGEEWRDKTTETLAIVVNNQSAFKNYQEKCEADRATITKRIKDVEAYQIGQRAQVGILAALAAGAGSCITWAIGFFFKH